MPLYLKKKNKLIIIGINKQNLFLSLIKIFQKGSLTSEIAF